MSAIDDAWRLVQTGGPVDAERLFQAVVSEQTLLADDSRTQLLVRDSLQGLRGFWGAEVFGERIRSLPQVKRIALALEKSLDEEGFPSLRENLMNPTDPATVLQMFRELGSHLNREVSITIGGSLALMLDAILVRHTEDVDVVNELPDSIRHQHELLNSLAKRYRLKLAHFQSHYLPDGWEARSRALGRFGTLTVRTIDPLDVLVGKLFSRRVKDLDDVRFALPKIDRGELKNRIATATQSFRRDSQLTAVAQQNWYILTGESTLP